MRSKRFISVLGMLCLCAVYGCNGDKRVLVDFELRSGPQASIQCGQSFDVGGEKGIKLRGLKFFVHDVQVWSPGQKAWLDVQLRGDNPAWYTDGVALIDLDDAKCKGADQVSQERLQGEAPVSDWTKLKFKLGVPFRLNHEDPMKATSPLNFMPMHWGWQAGYKFLRLELEQADGRPWAFHLGSVGCQGEVGNITGCKEPNRVEVELARKDTWRLRAGIDLSRLLLGLEISKTRDCMSQPGDPTCALLFKNLKTKGPFWSLHL